MRLLKSTKRVSQAKVSEVTRECSPSPAHYLTTQEEVQRATEHQFSFQTTLICILLPNRPQGACDRVNRGLQETDPQCGWGIEAEESLLCLIQLEQRAGRFASRGRCAPVCDRP